jgi:putative ABC transport system ATP-binding protein
VVAAEGLCRCYGEGDAAVQALRGVSLSVARGELVGVMGPSGSGKSTLLHILAGLDRPSGGEAFIDGTALSGLDDRGLTALRRGKIGFVFQFFNLLPMLSAEANIVLPLKLAGERWEQAWVDELIQRVGLGKRRSHLPSELSGGQQQRVAIARALALRPSVIFADEPTGNLDSKSGADVLRLLRTCTEEFAQTVVMVTHEPQATTITDRVLLLADGLLVEELRGVAPEAIVETLETVS